MLDFNKIAIAANTALGVCVALAPLSGTAQDQPAMRALEEITVTAQRRSESVLDVPISIDVKTAENLQNAGISNIQDVSLVSPGLNFTMSGPYAQPTIRGLSVDAATISNESNVAIYIDGVYQPVQQGNFFELADIEQISVLKGPQGTLFGRNAAAGAIQVSTRGPSFTHEGQLAITGSAFDERGRKLGVKGFTTGPISETLAYSISGFYSDNSGYYKDVFQGKKAGDATNAVIRAKLLFEPSEDIRITASGFYSESKDYSTYALTPIWPISAAADLPSGSKPYEIAHNEKNYSDMESYGGSLHAEFDVFGGTFSSITAYSELESLLLADADATPLANLTYLLNTPNKSWQQELVYVSPDLGPLNFVTGAFYFNSVDRYNPLQVGQTFDTPDALIYGRTETDAYAAFGEANLRLFDDFVLTGGIRYSTEKRHYEGGFGTPELFKIGDKKFSDWTPRASIRYEFSPQSNIYFTYSEGFKSGLFDATSFSPIAIEPETVKAYEVGVKTRIGDFAIDAAIFYNDVKDRQVSVNGPNALPQLRNAASAKVEGADISVIWARGNFYVDASTSWLSTAEYTSFPNASVMIPDPVTGNPMNVERDLSGTRMQKSPKWQASLLLGYERDYDWGTLGTATNIAYSSSYFYMAGGVVKQSDYVKINTNVSYTTPSGGMKFTAFVRNLTNEETIQNFIQLNVAYAAPREIGFTTEFKF